MKKTYFTKTLLLIAFLATISAVTNAQLTGWGYVMPIKITEKSGTLLLNHQIALTINTAALITAGKMQASGNDIRFGNDCQGDIMYNYWIDSAINTNHTVIWVKVDSLQPSQTRTIFMFTGNPAAPGVSSVPATFVGPLSATDSITGGTSGGSTNSQRGFRFTPKQDIIVTAWGKYEPNGSLRYVTIFDFTTTAILSQGQVSGAASTYSYQALANPIALAKDSQYVVELYQGASDGYFYQSSSQMNAHLTYGDMRYCNACTQNTFPISTLPGYQYGYPDIEFYITTDTVSPAPTYTLDGIMAPPTVIAMATPDSVCPGNTVTLTGGGANTYSWSGGESNGVAFIPAKTTEYTVMGTDTVGCMGTDSVLVVVKSCTGIDNLAADNHGVYIYPNPASSEVNLDFTSITGEKTVTLYDISGRMILKETTNKTSMLLNISSVEQGAYFLKVTNGNSMISVKPLTIIK